MTTEKSKDIITPDNFEEFTEELLSKYPWTKIPEIYSELGIILEEKSLGYTGGNLWSQVTCPIHKDILEEIFLEIMNHLKDQFFENIRQKVEEDDDYLEDFVVANFTARSLLNYFDISKAIRDGYGNIIAMDALSESDAQELEKEYLDWARTKKEGG